MSAGKNQSSDKSTRYPEDRGVGGILGGYQRSRPEPTEPARESTPAKEKNDEAPAQQETPQSPAPGEGQNEEATPAKARVLYHLPKTHIAALDEIKAELKGHKGYSARDASYSAIVTQAIERYYTDLFPDREPPG